MMLAEKNPMAHDFHEPAKWNIHWKLEKFHGEDMEQVEKTGELPYETVERDGNLLMYGGVSCIWEDLIGNGTATAGQTLTYFNNGNAAVGVGDSSTAAAGTQTDLQGTNKVRTAMNGSYPTHTDGTTSGAASIVFQSSYTNLVANFAWNEVGVFNATSGGRMLNRLVQSFGTKSGGTWSMTVTITIS